jgi:CRISPR/Cas system-associated exonuclease Cas4 (RecB family)
MGIEKGKRYESEAMVYGTLFHTALEHYYKGVDWVIPLLNESQTYPDYPHLYEEVRKAMRYYIPHLPKVDKVLSTELEFSVETDDYTFTGIIDLVAVIDGVVTLVDFKTHATLPNETEYMLDMQLPLYKWAYEKLTGTTVEAMQYWQIRRQSPKEPKMTDKGNVLSFSQQVTTWEVWSEGVRKMGDSPEKYKDKITPYLKEGIDFFRVDAILDNIDAVQQIENAVETVRTIYKRKDALARYSHTTCPTCPFFQICVHASMGNELDLEVIKSMGYTVNE